MRRGMLAICAVFVVAVGAAAAAVPPSELTNKLFATAFRDSEIPSGIYGPAKVTLEKPAKKAIGKVAVAFGDANVVIYSVYPSANAAAKRMADPTIEGAKDAKYTLVGRVPGWGKQSKMWIGTLSGENVFGKKVKNGMTILGIVRGPVIIFSISVSSDSETSGDMQSARKLLVAGAKHLARVQAS